jgi:hypothetical protein
LQAKKNKSQDSTLVAVLHKPEQLKEKKNFSLHSNLEPAQNETFHTWIRLPRISIADSLVRMEQVPKCHYQPFLPMLEMTAS